MDTEAESERALQNIELLARRIDAVPLELSAAPLPDVPDFAGFTRWVVTGIGASEGPARLLVAQLLDAGLCARFQPVTAFLDGATSPAADVLVVVSQQLSPNARIPLERRGRYRAVVLITASDPVRDARCAALKANGVTVLRHPPEEENGLFLRVIGPTLATRMVLHLAASVAAARGAPVAWASRLDAIGAAMARARSRVEPVPSEWLFGPTAITTAGDDGSLAVGLRTKLLEALGAPEASLWDLCGLVHGPLQSFFDTRRLVFVLEAKGDRRATMLRKRLAQILDPARHRIHVVEADLPSPLSYFEYAAAFDAIVLHALRERPRDLGDWPSKGQDGPIYELDGSRNSG
jgi:hypothetical protein